MIAALEDNLIDDFYNLATKNIANIVEECKKYSIDFDYILRDDDNDLSKGSLKKGIKKINYCPSCGASYGTDFSVNNCKKCGDKLRFAEKNTFSMAINHNSMMRKIEKICFVPTFAKSRLIDFIKSMPLEYDLILEKQRKYTSSIDGINLDPKYTAISLLASARQTHQDCNIIHIHGDVVKKFTYYVLAYLNDVDIPKVDVMHGNIVDPHKQKMRYASSDGRFNGVNILGVNNRILRAIFLSHSIKDDIILDKDMAISKQKYLTKFFVLCNRIQEERNYDPVLTGLRPELKDFLETFCLSVEKWDLSRAFNVVDNLVHYCWKIIKHTKLSMEEIKMVKDIQYLYFGDKQ